MVSLKFVFFFVFSDFFGAFSAFFYLLDPDLHHRRRLTKMFRLGPTPPTYYIPVLIEMYSSRAFDEIDES